MADKLPYQLTINLKSFRPEAVEAALRRFEQLCSEHDQIGAITTKVVIESNDEDALIEMRNQFEVWLRAARALVEGDVTMRSPLVRPKPQLLPMDAVDGFNNATSGIRGKYGIDEVTMSANGRSVTLTSETARNAAEMLQEDDDA